MRYGAADSGARAIVPGKPRASEMIRRILIEDTDENTNERMPPLHSHKRLTPEEIKKLREWIRQVRYGASIGPSWHR